MAGKNQGQDDGPEEAGKSGRSTRGRKPSVPPIIDLEATEVEGSAEAESSGASGTATRIDPDKSSSSGASGGSRRAGASPRSRWRKFLDPRLWTFAMRRLMALRIRQLRWSRIGAVAAAALILFIGGIWLGRQLVPQVQAPDASAVRDQQLADIESSVRTLSDTAAALGDRLDTIEGAVDGLSQHVQQTETTAAQALDGLDSMQATLDALAEVSPSGEDQDSLGRLQLQLGALATRFESLEAALSSLADRSADTALEQRMDTLTSALTELETAMQQALEQGAGDAIAGNRAAIGELADEVRAGLAALEARIEARLDAFEQAPQSAPRTPALTVAVARLQQAVDAGTPYGPELDALVALAPHYEELAVLAAHSETGVAARTDLVARYGDVMQAVRAGIDGEAAEPAEEPSFMDGIWARMRALVEVRRDDGPAGDALLARLEAAQALVNAGSLQAAADALSDLSGDTTVGPWLDAVHARLQVEEAMADVVRRSLSDVTAGGGRSGS